MSRDNSRVTTGMWYQAVANVLRRGGVGASKVGSHTHQHTQNPSSVKGLVTPCLPRRSWAQPGWLQAFCVCVCVCDTKGVPAWAAICHPPSQGQKRGGGDPCPLKPPVGPFSQSHAAWAPCLKSHACLSGTGMAGGGWS